MPSKHTTMPVPPASERDLPIVGRALDDLEHLIHAARGREPAAFVDSLELSDALDRHERAVAAMRRIALQLAGEEQAGRPEVSIPKSSRRALAPARSSAPAVQSESEGFEPPNAFASPDFESGSSSSEGNGSGEEPDDDEEPGARGFSPRARQLAALAWDLVERDPKLAARVAFDLVELDEYDPLACAAPCCNSPLPIGVRP